MAVYARSSWAAIRGREKLQTVWDESAAEKRSSEAMFAEFREKAQSTGAVAAQKGDPDEALKGADKVIEAEYTFPWIAHAPMEPLAAYLYWDGDSVNAKYGCQIQTLDQKQFCDYFQLPPEKVHIETILAGGSFGRRIDLGNKVMGPDLAADLSAVAKAIGPKQGVKLISTREDDLTGGWYRPMMLHRFRAAIKDNKIVAWTNTVVGQSFTVNSAFAAMVKRASTEPWWKARKKRLIPSRISAAMPTLSRAKSPSRRCVPLAVPTPGTPSRALSINCYRKPVRIPSKAGLP